MTAPTLLALADRIEVVCNNASPVNHGSGSIFWMTARDWSHELRALAAPQVEMVSELPNVREQFTEWLAREMPAGTVIGNPRWWAPKIIRAFHDYRTIARERDKLTSPGAAELPDLPDSYGDHCVTDSVRTMREPGYTADQMRAYAQSALNARAGGDGGMVERMYQALWFAQPFIAYAAKNAENPRLAKECLTAMNASIEEYRALASQAVGVKS